MAITRMTGDINTRPQTRCCVVTTSLRTCLGANIKSYGMLQTFWRSTVPQSAGSSHRVLFLSSINLSVESHVLNLFRNPLSANTVTSALWRRINMDADSYDEQHTNTHN